MACGQTYNVSASQITVPNLIIGRQYYFTLGPNEVNLVCGSTTLTANGSFYATATTAVITGTAPSLVFSGSLQQAKIAANLARGGQVHGAVDMGTDGPYQSGWGYDRDWNFSQLGTP